MCTAVSVVAGDHYFGRNLDYEITFGEKICITPRNFTFEFTIPTHSVYPNQTQKKLSCNTCFQVYSEHR